jgi:hypothetical protein
MLRMLCLVSPLPRANRILRICAEWLRQQRAVEEAAHDTLDRAQDFGSGAAEDVSALQNFAQT